MYELWMRVGVTLNVTKNEIEALLGNTDLETCLKTFENIVIDGRAKLDGETYIPYDSLENINETFETSYTACDIGFDIDPSSGYVVAREVSA